MCFVVEILLLSLLRLTVIFLIQLNNYLFPHFSAWWVLYFYPTLTTAVYVINLFSFKIWIIGKLVFPLCFWSLLSNSQPKISHSLHSHDAIIWNDCFLVAKLTKALNHMSGMWKSTSWPAIVQYRPKKANMM